MYHEIIYLWHKGEFSPLNDKNIITIITVNTGNIHVNINTKSRAENSKTPTGYRLQATGYKTTNTE